MKSFYNKTYSASEGRYCVTRRELLAIKSIKNSIIIFMAENIRIGQIMWLQNFKNPEGQIARWFEFLSQYVFQIEHRAGRIHNNADSMSRICCNNKVMLRPSC